MSDVSILSDVEMTLDLQFFDKLGNIVPLSEYTVSSSNQNVVAINGVIVTPKAIGTATLTIAWGAGLDAQKEVINVTVCPGRVVAVKWALNPLKTA